MLSVTQAAVPFISGGYLARVDGDRTRFDGYGNAYLIKKMLLNRKFSLKILKTGKSKTDRVEYKRRVPACSRQSQTTQNKRVGGVRVQYVVCAR
jgi:hypothetical protein